MTFTLPKLFPHFSHRIPARLVFSLEILLLWGGLIAIYVVNILLAQTNRPAYWNELMKFFSSPFSVTRHIDLASMLWQQGQTNTARQLMISAQSIAPTVQSRAQGNTVTVLGSATSPMDTLTQWEHETDQLRGRYAFWQTVVISKPDYRDAYIMLASLAYQMKRPNESKNWLSKALSLDPNSQSSQQLSVFLQGK